MEASQLSSVLDQVNKEGKEKYVHAVFDSIAPYYDLMNVVMTGGMVKLWHRAFTRHTNLKPGDHSLDVACGTGDLAILTAGQVGSAGKVTGVDFSEEMLKRARAKGKNLVMADLHHLPFRDGCIDGVASVNVFYQLDLPEVFLREVHRVLKPRGKAVISTPRRGASSLWCNIELIKTAMRNPKLLIDVGKLVECSMVTKKIIDTNPSAFYDKEELKKLLKDFEVQSIKKAYKGQNWLVIACKPTK